MKRIRTPRGGDGRSIRHPEDCAHPPDEKPEAVAAGRKEQGVSLDGSSRSGQKFGKELKKLVKSEVSKAKTPTEAYALKRQLGVYPEHARKGGIPEQSAHDAAISAAAREEHVKIVRKPLSAKERMGKATYRG